MSGMTRYWRRWALGKLLVLGGAIGFSGNCAFAQSNIVPDNSLGAESSVVTPNVNINGIPSERIDGGAIRSANLFHSFGEFNIDSGRGAYFTNPAGIENIFSRVTGGNRSEIFGKLGVLGNANLFLINPSGIIFGRNASLDVRGSFVGTTANAIQFGNQGFFSATNPSTPELLTINPSAFFFNQIAAAPIQNNSQASAGTAPIGLPTSGLRVPDGQSLLLLGGNVSLDGGRIRAYGGRVELGGLSSEGTVGLQVDGNNLSLSFPAESTRADVSLTNGASVRVDAAGGGSIAVNARNLDILGGSFLGAGIGEGLGSVGSIAGDITLDATGEIKVVGSDVFNNVRPQAVGNGGNIIISSGSLSLTDDALLSASTGGQANAGSINVRIIDSVSLKDSYIFNSVERGGVGNGGDINISATTLSLTNGAQLQTLVRQASSNQAAGRGEAGNVNVNVTGAVTIAGKKDRLVSAIISQLGTGAIGKGGNINIASGSLSLSDGAALQASTFGQGNAGTVSVGAIDSVSLKDASILSTVESGGIGNGGDININAASLSLTDGAELVTAVRETSFNQAAGRGEAGNVNVNVTGAVTIAGSKDELRSAIFTRLGTGAIGKGGDITIFSGSLSLTDRAAVDTSTSGQGQAGKVNLRAINSVSLKDASIFSTVETGAVGNGGDINIRAASLSLTDSAQLVTTVREASANQPAGRGEAGDVNIDVTGAVTIAGEKDGLVSAINSSLRRGAIGKGGNITISSGSLSLTDSAALTASTSGQGNAGTIEINAADAVRISGTSSTTGRSSELSTFTNSSGTGGDITINTSTFSVSDGAVLDARTTNNGNGGDIRVSANRAEVLNGGQLLSTTSGSGRAGKITVNATDSVIVNGSDATFNSRKSQFPTEVVNLGAVSGLFVRSQSTGSAGDIEVTSPQIRLDNSGRFIAESALGNGGNITLQLGDLLLLRRGSLISATAGTAQAGGDGGNITINAPSGFIVAVPSENSDITANAYTGSGGKVQINANGIYGTQFREKENPQTSDITASSTFGINGTVELNTPGIDPSRGLVNLPTVPLDTEVSQICQPRTAENQSSFIITGRGGLPPNPRTDLLSGDAVQVDWVTLKPRGENRTSTNVSKKATSPTPAPIVEAQGWVRNAKGEVVLTAYAPTATPHSSWLTPASCP